jgi:hypothetical protein
MEPLIPVFIVFVPISIAFVYFLITISKDKKKGSSFRRRHRIRYE